VKKIRRSHQDTPEKLASERRRGRKKPYIFLPYGKRKNLRKRDGSSRPGGEGLYLTSKMGEKEGNHLLETGRGERMFSHDAQHGKAGEGRLHGRRRKKEKGSQISSQRQSRLNLPPRSKGRDACTEGKLLYTTSTGGKNYL